MVSKHHLQSQRQNLADLFVYLWVKVRFHGLTYLGGSRSLCLARCFFFDLPQGLKRDQTNDERTDRHRKANGTEEDRRQVNSRST